jgi:acyl dehydratase
VSISSDIVGRTGEPITHEIDNDWVTACAAAVGASARTSHPLFSVCFEWAIFLHPRHMATGLTPGDLFRGVHATHDVAVHRPVRAGMRVTTTPTITSVESRRSGAYQLVRLETVDAEEEPVATTWFGMVYRGLEVSGGGRSPEDSGPVLQPSPMDGGFTSVPIPVSTDAAVVYAEAARVWNPIHTDAAVAEAAGLPGMILQGTATLAMAVSRVMAERFGGDMERVVRIAGHFGAMVFIPSTVTLRIGPDIDNTVRFEVLTPGGNKAICDGLLTVRSNPGRLA